MIRTDNSSRNRRKIRVKKRVITNDSSDDSDIERTIRRVRTKFGARTRCPTSSSSVPRRDTEQARFALHSCEPSASSEHDVDSENPKETSSDSVPVETAVSSSPSDSENSNSVTLQTGVSSSPSDPERKDDVPEIEFKQAGIETSNSTAQESDGSNKVVSQRCSASSASARTSSESEAEASPWKDNYFEKHIKTIRSDASSVSASPIMRTVLRKRTPTPGRAKLSTSVSPTSSLLPVLSPSRSRPSKPTSTQESRNNSRSGSSSSESSNSSNHSQRSSVSSSSSNSSSSSSTSKSKSNSSCTSSASSDSNKSSRRSNSNKSSRSVDSNSDMSRSSMSRRSNNSTSNSNSSSGESGSGESSPNNNQIAIKIPVNMTESTSQSGHSRTSPINSKRSPSSPTSQQSAEICDKRFASDPGKLPVSNHVKLPSSRSNRMPEIVPDICFSTTPVKNSGKSTAKSHGPPIQIIVKIPLTNDLINSDKTPDNVPLKYLISIPQNNITNNTSGHMANKKSINIPGKFPFSFPVSISLDHFVSVPRKSPITISSKVSESNNLVDEYPVSIPVTRPVFIPVTRPVSIPVTRPIPSMSIITPEEVDLPSNSTAIVPDTSSQNSEKDEIVNMSEGSDHDEEVSLVKEICGKRWHFGSWQYCVKWHGYGTEDDTWEEEDVLECFDHIAAYESNKPPPPPAPAQGTQYEDGPHGYERGLPAEKILGASRLPNGQTCYLIKWEGCYEPDWITASQANHMSPQTVINFFEQRYRLALEQMATQEQEQEEDNEDEKRETVQDKKGKRETTENGKEKEKNEKEPEEKNEKDKFTKIEGEMETEEYEETTDDEKIARNKQLENDKKKEEVLVNNCEKMVIGDEKETGRKEVHREEIEDEETEKEETEEKGVVSDSDDDIITMEVESELESELDSQSH